MNRGRSLILAGLIAALATFGSVAGADARNRGTPEGIVPLSRVVPAVKRAVPGHIMSARLRGDTYFIRILTRRGDVVEVLADGRTGRILEINGR